uniref:Uncharacterized protein n=1 Tax=Romanomermis culicivorax TaxID=13658 RepID=A0A915HVN0_ROMCU
LKICLFKPYSEVKSPTVDDSSRLLGFNRRHSAILRNKSAIDGIGHCRRFQGFNGRQSVTDADIYK